MTYTFKKGDTVYNPAVGKCLVMEDQTNKDEVLIRGQNTARFYCVVELLSFKPWVPPCHERPIKDGWWLVKLIDGSIELRWMQDGRIAMKPKGVLAAPWSGLKFLRFITANEDITKD